MRCTIDNSCKLHQNVMLCSPRHIDSNKKVAPCSETIDKQCKTTVYGGAPDVPKAFPSSPMLSNAPSAFPSSQSFPELPRASPSLPEASRAFPSFPAAKQLSAVSGPLQHHFFPNPAHSPRPPIPNPNPSRFAATSITLIG